MPNSDYTLAAETLAQAFENDYPEGWRLLRSEEKAGQPFLLDEFGCIEVVGVCYIYSRHAMSPELFSVRPDIAQEEWVKGLEDIRDYLLAQAAHFQGRIDERR